MEMVVTRIVNSKTQQGLLMEENGAARMQLVKELIAQESFVETEPLILHKVMKSAMMLTTLKETVATTAELKQDGNVLLSSVLLD